MASSSRTPGRVDHGILAAIKINDHESYNDIDTIKYYRVANAALVIAGIPGSLAIAVTFIIGNIASKAAIMIIIQGAFIVRRNRIWVFAEMITDGFFVIVSHLLSAGYKLDTALNPTHPYSTGAKVTFYIFNALFQWCAALGYSKSRPVCSNHTARLSTDWTATPYPASSSIVRRSSQI